MSSLILSVIFWKISCWKTSRTIKSVPRALIWVRPSSGLAGLFRSILPQLKLRKHVKSRVQKHQRPFLLSLRAIKMFSARRSHRIIISARLEKRSAVGRKGKVSALFAIHFVDRPAEHREIIVALGALSYSSFDTNWSDFYSGPITRSLLNLSHFRSCAELRMGKAPKLETNKVIDRLWNWVDAWAETLRASCLSPRVFKSLFEIASDALNSARRRRV